jgi:Asp-tRNA(Asn)/Glu-tRNA(Gln) amidotransferase C subunit
MSPPKLEIKGEKGMSNLTFQEVAALAKAVDLTLSDDDIVEVTHRLNVILGRMDKISHPDLDDVAPIPFLPLEEVDDGQ